MAVNDFQNVATPRACLCYTIDEGYLLPALTSAIMARRQTSQTVADIVISCFGSRSDLTGTIAEVCAKESIVFLVVPTGELQGMPMICARFFLDKILDPYYTSITYLDADTQVIKPIDPLLTSPIAAGSLLAVPDLMALMSGSKGEPWQQQAVYFRSIGIADDRHSTYFNSGMIRFLRSDWEAISKDCLSLCRSPIGQTFKFADQDALNIVVAGRARLASLRWNFPGFFLGRKLEDIAAPSIIHYMSNPRPWHGSFDPWGEEGTAPYISLIKKYPELTILYKPFKGGRLLRYRFQQNLKRFSEDWGSQPIRDIVMSSEKTALV
jgi:hypothetical protein